MILNLKNKPQLLLIVIFLLCQCTSKDEISGTSVETGNPTKIAMVNSEGSLSSFSGKVTILSQNHNPYQDEPLYSSTLLEEQYFGLPPVNIDESIENEQFKVTFIGDSLFGVLTGVYFSEDLQSLRTTETSGLVILEESFTLSLQPKQSDLLESFVQAYIEGTTLKYEGNLPIKFKIPFNEDLKVGFVNPNGILMFLLPMSDFNILVEEN